MVFFNHPCGMQRAVFYHSCIHHCRAPPDLAWAGHYQALFIDMELPQTVAGELSPGSFFSPLEQTSNSSVDAGLSGSEGRRQTVVAKS